MLEINVQVHMFEISVRACVCVRARTHTVYMYASD